MMLTLYGFPHSHNTRKVLATAKALNIILDLKIVNIVRKESFKPDYLALNPTGLTPTLVDGDFVLWESNAIIQYLANLTPGSGLWPLDIRRQADITRWQCWQLMHWSIGLDILLFERLVKRLEGLGEADPSEVSRGEKHFHATAQILDKHLAGRKTIVGSGMTLADYTLAANLHYAEVCPFPLEGYGNIRRWLARVEADPAWRATAPDWSLLKDDHSSVR
jgi:glutathione S-transferase